jgi:hypothetical protein
VMIYLRHPLKCSMSDVAPFFVLRHCVAGMPSNLQRLECQDDPVLGYPGGFQVTDAN